MLISGRAERVVVVAGDNGSGGTLLPWLGEKAIVVVAFTQHSSTLDFKPHILLHWLLSQNQDQAFGL